MGFLPMTPRGRVFFWQARWGWRGGLEKSPAAPFLGCFATKRGFQNLPPTVSGSQKMRFFENQEKGLSDLRYL